MTTKFYNIPCMINISHTIYIPLLSDCVVESLCPFAYLPVALFPLSVCKLVKLDNKQLVSRDIVPEAESAPPTSPPRVGPWHLAVGLPEGGNSRHDSGGS